MRSVVDWNRRFNSGFVCSIVFRKSGCGRRRGGGQESLGAARLSAQVGVVIFSVYVFGTVDRGNGGGIIELDHVNLY